MTTDYNVIDVGERFGPGRDHCGSSEEKQHEDTKIREAVEENQTLAFFFVSFETFRGFVVVFCRVWS